MNSQQSVEVQFWRELYNSVSQGDPMKYLAFRATDLSATAGPMLPYLLQEIGAGLDLGCGLVSKLGFLTGCECLIAVDPLIDEYRAIYDYPWPHVTRLKADGEHLDFSADAQYDFVWCCNVIDHTPNSQRMADEIWRVLKPGGRLYLHVNYDNELTAAHYELWSDGVVADKLKRFTPVKIWKEWWAIHQKFVHRGIYRK